MSKAWTLGDPRPLAAEAPYTFFLPGDAEAAAVATDDGVKLIFEYSQPTEKWTGERMWVIVTSVNGDELRGELNNHPDEPNSPLKAGDQVIFRRYHIIDIEWHSPEQRPLGQAHRQYWDRCYVDDCVLDGTEPVEFIYREEPFAQENERFPDSGWRIRGRAGTSTVEEIVARKMSYVALGAVLNRDDSWIKLIDAPIGAAFNRDFETETYVEES